VVGVWQSMHKYKNTLFAKNRRISVKTQTTSLQRNKIHDHHHHHHPDLVSTYNKLEQQTLNNSVTVITRKLCYSKDDRAMRAI